MWRLPPALRWYVLAVTGAAAGAAGAAAALASWHARDLMLFALLAGFGAAAIELTRKAAEPAGVIKEVYVAWQLPVALLLPPVYCLAASALTFTLLQFRTRRTIVHRRVFSAAASGLSLAGASLVFHALGVSEGRPLVWLAAAGGCALLRSAAGTGLVTAAVVMADRTVSVRDQILSRGPLLNDACEAAAGVLLAGAVARIGLALLIPALPLMVVFQWWCRRAQRQSAARLDPQTGLLHAGTWRAEAEVLLEQARHAGAGLAVGIADLDHFKAVNDRYGYQAGDGVIAAAAGIVRAGLRSGDLVGRFGGAGFIFLLPGATAGEALRAAGRLRGAVAAWPVPAGPGGRVFHVTVSLGLAATASPAGCDLTDLLAAADAALHRAKEGGRDRVCQAPDLTAGSETRPETARAAAGSQATAGPAAGRAGREAVSTARRELGKELAACRARARLTQRELAQRTGYSRSAVADAESGAPRSGAFWAAVNRAVGADGSLAARQARIEAAVTVARRRSSRQAWIARTGTAEPGLSGTDPGQGTLAISDSACPRCGELLTVTAHVTTALAPQITQPGSQPPG